MPPALPIKGSCRCGRVRLPIDAEPTVTGDTVIGGLPRDRLRHHHCGHRKGWLFTRIEPDPGFTNVRVGVLDGRKRSRRSSTPAPPRRCPGRRHRHATAIRVSRRPRRSARCWRNMRRRTPVDATLPCAGLRR